MAGIFPSVGVSASNALNSVSSPNVAEGCTPLWYPPRCNPRFDPAQANAVISEIINAVNCSGFSYDCEGLDNLCKALRLPCRSELASAPALGVPRMYVDDTVSPSVVYFWDCDTSLYRMIDPDARAVRCLSELSVAPSAGVPRMYVDDSTPVASLKYWDCDAEAYRSVSPSTAAESVVCRSQLVSPPAAGVPRVFIDDAVSPAVLNYWDCGDEVYRQVPTAASTSGLMRFIASRQEGTNRVAAGVTITGNPVVGFTINFPVVADETSIVAIMGGGGQVGGPAIAVTWGVGNRTTSYITVVAKGYADNGSGGVADIIGDVDFVVMQIV